MTTLGMWKLCEIYGVIIEEGWFTMTFTRFMELQQFLKSAALQQIYLFYPYYCEGRKTPSDAGWMPG